MNIDRQYYDCISRILDAAELMNALSRNANYNVVADHAVRSDLRDVLSQAQSLYDCIYKLVERQMRGGRTGL